MAHAWLVEENVEKYLAHVNQDENWVRYLKILTEENGKLYGRLCYSQKMRFLIGLWLDNDGCVYVQMWREDPKDIGYSIADTNFKLRLSAALNMFPELKAVELFEDAQVAWLRKEEKEDESTTSA